MKTQRPDPRDVLTTPQVCDLLEITRQTLYAWMERGRVKPWMKVGGASWLFIRDEVKNLRSARYVRHNDRPNGPQGRSMRKPVLSGAMLNSLMSARKRQSIE